MRNCVAGVIIFYVCGGSVAFFRSVCASGLRASDHRKLKGAIVSVVFVVVGTVFRVEEWST